MFNIARQYRSEKDPPWERADGRRRIFALVAMWDGARRAMSGEKEKERECVCVDANDHVLGRCLAD